MTSRSGKRIYVFERQPQFCTMLETALASDQVSISGFSRHQECLERLATKPCDLLIVDLEGRTLEGLNVLQQSRRASPWISRLAIVGHAAIPCAIKAVRAGADDCLDKPVQHDRLLAAVGAQLARVHASTRRCPRALTRMEVQILQWILAGKISYEIAADLHRSKRTIDVHRKNIMRKLHATGLVDLIKQALTMGFSDQPERANGVQEPEPTIPIQRADLVFADE